MRNQTFLAVAMAAVVIAWWGTAQAGGDGGTGPNVDFSGAWRMVGPASNRFSLTFAPAPGNPAGIAGTLVGDDDGPAGPIDLIEVRGNRLTGSYQFPDSRGVITLTMSPGGSSFEGRLLPANAPAANWRGYRSPPGLADNGQSFRAPMP